MDCGGGGGGVDGVLPCVERLRPPPLARWRGYACAWFQELGVDASHCSGGEGVRGERFQLIDCCGIFPGRSER